MHAKTTNQETKKKKRKEEQKEGRRHNLPEKSRTDLPPDGRLTHVLGRYFGMKVGGRLRPQVGLTLAVAMLPS